MILYACFTCTIWIARGRGCNRLGLLGRKIPTSAQGKNACVNVIVFWSRSIRFITVRRVHNRGATKRKCRQYVNFARYTTTAQRLSAITRKIYRVLFRYSQPISIKPIRYECMFHENRISIIVQRTERCSAATLLPTLSSSILVYA